MKTLLVVMIALTSMIASADAPDLDCKGAIAKAGAKKAITTDLKEDAIADHTLSARDAKNKVEFRVIGLPANQLLMSIFVADKLGNMITEAQVTTSMPERVGVSTIVQGQTANGAVVMLSCQSKK